jgi:hypothetical protein
VSAIVDRPATAGEASPIAPRPEVADVRPPGRTIDDILRDPRYSDRAKRLAEYLEGRCKAPWKWVAWPKVSTVDHDLGWEGTRYGGRKRFERAVRELAEGGDLRRMTVRQVVEWFDAEGTSRGLRWDPGLPRTLRQSAKVCVLLWRVPGPAEGLPILTRCDTGVPSSPDQAPPERADVASPETRASHGDGAQVSHPSLNVRSLKERSERTLDVADGDGIALARGEGEEAPGPAAEPQSGGEVSPAAGQAEEFARRLERRGLRLELLTDPVRGEVIFPRPLCASTEPIRPDEVAELLSLKPQLLAFLKGETPPPVPEPAPRGPEPQSPPGKVAGGKRRPAPQVRAEVRDRVIAQIGSLQGNSDPESPRAAQRAISAAFNDHKPRSIGLYLDIASEVREGRKPPDVLIAAFEKACRPTVENRGAIFTTALKALVGRYWKERRA